MPMSSLPVPGPVTEPARLSACVICFNEEDRIGDCLSSLLWCDEIVVVDSHSADRTRVIAAAVGARVIERDWPGYAAQKEFAVRAATHDWVLCLDADERVSGALRDEIRALRDRGFPGTAGWEMPRCSWYEGGWVRHGTWYPDWSLRLFDRRRGRWQAHEAYDVHERVVLDGECDRLRGDLLHFPYRDRVEHLYTIDRYTDAIAVGMHAAGQRAGLGRLIGHPLWELFRALVIKRGFLDGRRGFRLAWLHARYVAMKYWKLRRLGRGNA